MRRILAAFCLAVAPAPAAAGPDDWDTASRVGEVALVATAFGVPLARGDEGGAWQAAGSIGASWGLTEVLKRTVREERPDASDRRGFPSGHTSISFAAAATLHNRHGWEVGLPATLVAGFVGLARVEAKKHRWHDVLAGAAIGQAAGWLITTRRDSNVRIVPWGDSGSGGVTVVTRF